jgi:hypothetical protein
MVLPLTQDVVRGHLVGNHTVGIYPLWHDEACWLVVVDFDNKTWQKHAVAFLAACREMNVPAILERSRSGNGSPCYYGHLRFRSNVISLRSQPHYGLSSSPATIQSRLLPECAFSFKRTSSVGALCPFSYFESCL